MTNRRDLVAEIEEVRARAKPAMIPVTIPFRMQMIALAFKAAPTLDPEFLRYLPIGTVACIEGFVRAAIRVIVDAGGIFVERAANLSQARDLKVDFQVLRAAHERRISAGELIAHVIPLNNLAQIGSVMSVLIGEDFFERVKVAHSRWAVEVEKKPSRPIIEDPARTFQHVDEMFRLRHIYVHELVDFQLPDRSAMADALESSVEFLTASSEVVGDVLYPDAPLTQADMNVKAAQDLKTTDEQVDTVCASLASKLDEGRRSKLAGAQAAWRQFQRLHADFVASEFQVGSIRPTIYASEAKSVADERLQTLNRLLDSLEKP